MWFIYDIILVYPFFIQKTQENEGGNCLTPLFLDSKLPSPGFCRDHFKYVASELRRFSPYFKTTHQPRTFLGTVNSYTKKTPLFVDVDSPRFQKKCQRVKKSTHFKRKSHLFTNPINDHQWLQGLLLFLSNFFWITPLKEENQFPSYLSWLVVSTHLKNMSQSQIGHLPPTRGEDKTYLKPPSPSLNWGYVTWRVVLRGDKLTNPFFFDHLSPPLSPLKSRIQGAPVAVLTKVRRPTGHAACDITLIEQWEKKENKTWSLLSSIVYCFFGSFVWNNFVRVHF